MDYKEYILSSVQSLKTNPVRTALTMLGMIIGTSAVILIASVGQSGGRSQAGLYFGIRRKGVPVDPLEWCRR